jgi:TrmH family RNA methyltransferase
MQVVSAQNTLVKYIQKLDRRKFREKEKRFCLEGSLMIEEALLFRWPMELLAYTRKWSIGRAGRDILRLASEMNLKRIEIKEDIFQSISTTQTPQGVLAVARFPENNLEELLTRKPSLLVLVNSVRDPGNLGAIIRGADAAAADGLLLTKKTVDLYNPKTLRATMGSIFHLPVVTSLETDDLPSRLGSAGLRIVVGDPSARDILSSCDFTLPTVLAVGNEARGCSETLLRKADQIVRIPMPGRAESLNVAQAASIMLYEVIRQRYG